MKTLKEEINRLQSELQSAVEERMALEAALEAMEEAAAAYRGREATTGAHHPFFSPYEARRQQPGRVSGRRGSAGARHKDSSITSTPLRTLVARLRLQLNEKEKQQAALAGALAELKV
jgi:hypothetical protein